MRKAAIAAAAANSHFVRIADLGVMYSESPQSAHFGHAERFLSLVFTARLKRLSG
jgi:hypothetical protein